MIASVQWGWDWKEYKVAAAAGVEGTPFIQGQERAASEIKWEMSPKGTAQLLIPRTQGWATGVLDACRRHGGQWRYTCRGCRWESGRGWKRCEPYWDCLVSLGDPLQAQSSLRGVKKTVGLFPGLGGGHRQTRGSGLLEVEPVGPHV